MNYDLKVIFVIENNNGCASIMNFQQSVYGHHCAAAFENPDYVTIAKAYGMNGFKIKNSDEYKAVLSKALASDKSSIIEAVIDPKPFPWE
jgi:acetolactate synthase-1/2/3 large subunit